jgi:hypothetical protein
MTTIRIARDAPALLTHGCCRRRCGCSRRPTRCKTVDIRGGNTEIGDLLTRGTTSDVYAWGSDSVVKVPRPGVPDHWIDIEASHSVRVHSIGLPTPAVLDVIDLDGRRAIVFERVRGPSMLDNLAAAPGDADSMARDLAAIQREFHSAGGPSELPDKNGRIAGKIATASLVTETERSEAVDLLGRLPGGTSICHGDFHPGNILIGAHGPVVIDWFDAATGHPLADIVRTSLLVRPLSSGAAGPAHLPGVPADVLSTFHRAYVDEMIGPTDFDIRTILTWEAVLSVSRLSEPVDGEFDDLLTVWRSMAHSSPESTTPLAAALRALSEQ